MTITAKTTKSVAGSKAKKLGEALETLTMLELIRQGYLVQRIATPCIVRGGRKIHTAPVVGDLVGVGSTGRAVLVECKAHQDRRAPRPSDFLPHQRKQLKRWHAAGALVLVAWLGDDGAVIEPVTSVLGDAPRPGPGSGRPRRPGARPAPGGPGQDRRHRPGHGNDAADALPQHIESKA